MQTDDQMAERLFGSPPPRAKHPYSGLMAVGLFKQDKAASDTRSVEERLYDNTPRAVERE